MFHQRGEKDKKKGVPLPCTLPNFADKTWLGREEKKRDLGSSRQGREGQRKGEGEKKRRISLPAARTGDVPPRRTHTHIFLSATVRHRGGEEGGRSSVAYHLSKSRNGGIGLYCPVAKGKKKSFDVLGGLIQRKTYTRPKLLVGL